MYLVIYTTVHYSYIRREVCFVGGIPFVILLLWFSRQNRLELKAKVGSSDRFLYFYFHFVFYFLALPEEAPEEKQRDVCAQEVAAKYLSEFVGGQQAMGHGSLRYMQPIRKERRRKF